VSSDSILVVDDDAAIRRMLARTLEAKGYAVVLDVNGRWARRAGRELELSPREVDLRELLLRNAGRW
jgi:DNA-binding response OmpR family regulator